MPPYLENIICFCSSTRLLIMAFNFIVEKIVSFLYFLKLNISSKLLGAVFTVYWASHILKIELIQKMALLQNHLPTYFVQKRRYIWCQIQIKWLLHIVCFNIRSYQFDHEILKNYASILGQFCVKCIYCEKSSWRLPIHPCCGGGGGCQPAPSECSILANGQTGPFGPANTFCVTYWSSSHHSHC